MHARGEIFHGGDVERYGYAGAERLHRLQDLVVLGVQVEKVQGLINSSAQDIVIRSCDAISIVFRSCDDIFQNNRAKLSKLLFLTISAICSEAE